MPSIEEIKKVSEDTLHLVKEWQAKNDKEIEDIKKGKYVPADIKEQNEKMNQKISELAEQTEKMAAAINRETAAGKDDPKAEENEFKSIARAWFRSGSLNSEQQKRLVTAYGPEFKALNAGTDPEGGFFVRPQYASQIVERLYESSPLRQFATVQPISTSEWIQPVVWDEAAASWVGEQGSRSATDEVDVSQITIKAHEMYAMPSATQSLLDDAAIDIEAWHARKVAEYMGRLEATAFITGNGVTQPKGIMSYSDGTGFGQVEQIPSGSAGAFTADGLMNLQGALFEPYQANARWLMARASATLCRQLKDGSGRYLWSMDKGLNNALESSLLGKPVHFASDIAAASSGSLSAAYGDFRAAYMIVDRIGMRVLRDVFSSKPYVLFYTTKRVGGQVVNFQAYKVQDLSAS